MSEHDHTDAHGTATSGDRSEPHVHNHRDADSLSHIASIYGSREDQFETAVPFIRQGLDRGERCLYIADDNTVPEVRAALREGGIDVKAACESGALTIHTKTDTYVQSGEFDQEATLDFWEDVIAGAHGEYEGVRATGEMTWALDERFDLDELIQYEATINTVYPDTHCVFLCQYNRERFPQDVISDVVRTHPLLVYDGTFCQNFQHRPPDEFFDAGDASTVGDRTVEELVSHTRSRHTLREREQYHRDLYEITSDPNRAFDEKLDALFDLGREFFDLEVGGLARVDPATDFWEVEATSGDHEHLRPGAQVALSETYCRLVADGAESAVGVTDPNGHGFEGTKAHEEFGVNAYLGANIELDGALDRTVFFVATESRIEPFTDAERTFHHLIAQWVESELRRRQREEQLAGLNDLSRKVMQAETQRDVSETVVEAAETTLDLPATAIALYDEQDGTLRAVAATGEATALLDAGQILDRGEGVGWNAFVQSTACRDTDPFSGTDVSERPLVTEVAAFPLGTHGVLVTGSTLSEGFSSSLYDLVETVAANTEAALDRAHREQQLREREETLTEQNESLESLERVNDVIRSIDQAMIQASSREEVVQAVCDRLTDDEAYRFAWVGSHDVASDTVRPDVWAGVEGGYLETVTPTVGDREAGHTPAGAAIETRSVQTWNNLAADPPFEPWRQAALNRGYQSCLAVPLRYQDTVYGVLTVYADSSSAFDEMEEAVLTELGETIGYALNSLERKQALISERSVALELELRAGNTVFSRLAAEHECKYEFERAVQRSDGTPGVFFTVRGASPNDVIAFGERAPEIEDVSVVDDRDDGTLFEARLHDSSFFSTLLDRGAIPGTFTASGDDGYAVVRVARNSDVRGLIELFERQYEDVDFVGRQEVDEPIETRQDFESELRARLTDRQEEVLEAAHVTGFFDWPRETSAQDLAALLDVSQPTVSRHIRAGERTLFDLLFDGD